MPDQAAKLREIATEHYANTEKVFMPGKRSGANVFAVASGKGGVGKTNIAVNLALKLSEWSGKVLLIDADINLANSDILLGITPKANMSDAIINDIPLSEVIHKQCGGIHFLPGGSGFRELVDLPEWKRIRIFRQLENLEKRYDYIILDSPAGLHKQVLDFLVFASQVIVVTTPEPTAIADAYALIKVLSLHNSKNNILMLVNHAGSSDHGKDIFKKFKIVVDKFLKIKIDYLGYIPTDKNITKAVMKQKPLVTEFPKSAASLCFNEIAERIVLKGDALKDDSKESFFEKVANFSVFH